MNRTPSLKGFTALALSVMFAFSIVPPCFADGDSWHHSWSHGPSGVDPFAVALPGPMEGGEAVIGYTPNPWDSDAFQPSGNVASSAPGPWWAEQGQSTGFQPWPMAPALNAGSNEPLAGYNTEEDNEALQAFLEDARERFTGASIVPGVSSLITPAPSSSILGGGG